MYSRRLNMASSMSAPELTNTCSMRGKVLSASKPQAEGSTLTALNPAALILSRSISCLSTRRASCALRTDREPRLSRHRPQETRRRLDQEATAVAGLPVGRYGAAMGEPVQGADGGLKNPVT